MSEYVPMGEDADDGLEAHVPAAPAANATSSTDNGTDVPMTPIMAAKVSELEELVAERTLDLQRLQAEYVNYKRRVDRDRAVSRQAGIEAVVTDLLPVIDSIEVVVVLPVKTMVEMLCASRVVVKPPPLTLTAPSLLMPLVPEVVIFLPEVDFSPEIA